MNQITSSPDIDVRLDRLRLHIVCSFIFWSINDSTVLRDVLETSTQHARDLYAGRESYTLGELELLSVFFNVSPAAWFDDLRPIIPEYRSNRGETEVIGRAWDRVMTARESGRQ